MSGSGSISKIIRALSSRRLSFVLLAIWAGLLAMWLIPFQIAGISEAQVTSIAQTWLPFRLAYAAVVVTTLACTIIRASQDLRRARVDPQLPETPPEKVEPDFVVPSLELSQAVSKLEDAGWSTRSNEVLGIGWRRRSSLLGGSAFHLGILVFMAAVALFTGLSSQTSFRLIEGERVGSVAGLTAEEASLRGLVADAELVRVEPVYFRDVLLFERLDATWRRADSRQQVFSLANPLWLDPMTAVSIQDFGLAPRLTVTRGTEVIQDTVAAMSIFPPGAEDTVELGNAGILVTASAFPDHGVVDGADVSLSYNVFNPRLRVSVAPADDPQVVLARALLAPGEELVIGPSDASEEPLTLAFESLERFGSFRIARSYAIPLLVLGATLMIGGLAWRVLWPRAELMMWETPSGLAVASRVDRAGVFSTHALRRVLTARGESR